MQTWSPMKPMAAIPSRERRRDRAFTLIELLVVIAIIALLMSILMPALSKARQQGWVIKCRSNLRQIGIAMQSYFMDEKDWFPFEKHGGLSMHGFYYGGHPGHEDWWGYRSPAYRDTPAGRPFNRYIYPDLPDWDVQPDEPEYETSRNLPVFMCPSDRGGFWNTEGGEAHNSYSVYEFSGSSYDFNYHFCLNWAIRHHGGSERHRWLHRANAFLRVQMQRDAARFIMLFEDPFDSALYRRVARVGWHNELNHHTLLFLDGHSAYKEVDTVGKKSGAGWKSCSGWPGEASAWWNNPEDPDYRYRDITPLPGG